MYIDNAMTNEKVIEHIHDLLWEYVSDYVEKTEDSKNKLHSIAIENNFPHYNPDCGEPIQQIDIQVCDEFSFTDCKVFENKIILSFEMDFIAIVNKDIDEKFYHIEGTAVGTLTVPSGDVFDYKKYDFDDMRKPQLMEHYDIVKDIDLHFEYVEYMGQ